MPAFLYLFNALMLGSLLLWPFVLVAGAMSLSAPGASDNLLTRLILAWSVFYPVPILVGIVGLWRSRKRADNRSLVIHSLITSTSLVVPILLFGALAIFCGGRFSCNA